MGKAHALRCVPATCHQHPGMGPRKINFVLRACLRAGCACLPEWNYTSLQGNNFHITSGCSNPDNESALPWCPVDPATCIHTPAALSGRLYWDYCYNLDDKVTIDTGVGRLHTRSDTPLQALPSSCWAVEVHRLLLAKMCGRAFITCLSFGPFLQALALKRTIIPNAVSLRLL